MSRAIVLIVLSCAGTLLTAFSAGVSSRVAAQPPIASVAVLGPEAAPILRLLDATIQIVNIQPGGWQAAQQHHQFDALIIPDDWSDGWDRQAAQQAGVLIFTVKRHISTGAMFDNITRLGTMIGQADRATRITSEIAVAIAALRAEARLLPPTRVLLLTPEGYTQGRGTLFTELIEIAGGINTAAEAGIPDARQISDAQIREAEPDVILLFGWTADASRDFTRNPLYAGIPAFDRRRIRRITPLGKDPATLVRELRWLHTVLHPMWM